MLKRIGAGMSGGIGSMLSDKEINPEKNNELAQLLSSYGLDKEPLNKHDELVYLQTDSLVPGSTQPRQHFNDASLEGLAESIRSSNGVIEPLIVEKLRNGSYEIIAGERRWRAANIIELEELPCIVRSNLGRQAKLVISLVENIQREDLNPIDEADGLRCLVDEYSLSHQQVADIVGRSRSAVSNLLRLLELTKQCKDAVLEHKIEMGHARAIVALDAALQNKLLKECIRKNLTVRAVEKRVKSLLALSEPDVNEGIVDDEACQLEKQFVERFSSAVYIKKLKGGQIVVKFKNADIFKKLMEGKA